MSRLLAPALCALCGLYCIVWGIVASAASLTYHLDGILFGVLLLLLALVYLRLMKRSSVTEP